MQNIVQIFNNPKFGDIKMLLTDANSGVSDFFIPSTYRDASGEESEYYNCTKKGCEILVNKLQGEKGIAFTARYINRFHNVKEKQKQVINIRIMEDDEWNRLAYQNY